MATTVERTPKMFRWAKLVGVLPREAGAHGVLFQAENGETLFLRITKEDIDTIKSITDIPTLTEPQAIRDAMCRPIDGLPFQETRDRSQPLSRQISLEELKAYREQLLAKFDVLARLVHNIEHVPHQKSRFDLESAAHEVRWVDRLIEHVESSETLPTP